MIHYLPASRAFTVQPIPRSPATGLQDSRCLIYVTRPKLEHEDRIRSVLPKEDKEEELGEGGTSNLKSDQIKHS